MTAGPRHIAIDRNFWTWAAVGTLGACGVGALYAWYLQRSGEWETGLPWEVALLERFHVTLPASVDWLLLIVPWLGTNLTILPGVLIASRLLWKRGRRDLVAALVVSAAGNYLVGFFLKFAFDRPRPALWQARGQFTGPSYPSGHAMMALSVLFLFSYLLRRERGWLWPYAASVIFAIVTVYSRLYLGVHWPTDVIGGAVIGSVWLLAMLRAMGTTAAALFDSGRSVPHAHDAAGEGSA